MQRHTILEQAHGLCNTANTTGAPCTPGTQTAQCMSSSVLLDSLLSSVCSDQQTGLGAAGCSGTGRLPDVHQNHTSGLVHHPAMPRCQMASAPCEQLASL